MGLIKDRGIARRLYNIAARIEQLKSEVCADCGDDLDGFFNGVADDLCAVAALCEPQGEDEAEAAMGLCLFCGGRFSRQFGHACPQMRRVG